MGYSPWGHKESDTTEHTIWGVAKINSELEPEATWPLEASGKAS